MLFPDSRVQRLAQKRRFWFYVRASLLVICIVVVSVAAGTAFQAISTAQDTRYLGRDNSFLKKYPPLNFGLME
jgi:hypothetical protein